MLGPSAVFAAAVDSVRSAVRPLCQVREAVPDAADLGFVEFVELIRDRMAAADALFPARVHRFRTELVPDVRGVPESWYREAFELLQRLGHISRAARQGGDVAARLSARGSLYWRVMQDDAA
jgi:hypothetical protein